MARRAGGATKGMRRVGGAHIGRVARRCYVCDWCGAREMSKPATSCRGCHRTAWLSFQSIAEADRYAALRLMQRAGLISDVSRQVRIPLLVRRPDGLMTTIGHYVADFTYSEGGMRIIEDVKSSGAIDPLAAWKLRHIEAQHEGSHLVRIVQT